MLDRAFSFIHNGKKWPHTSTFTKVIHSVEMELSLKIYLSTITIHSVPPTPHILIYKRTMDHHISRCQSRPGTWQ